MKLQLLVIYLLIFGINAFPKNSQVDSSSIIRVSKVSSKLDAQFPESYHDNMRILPYPRIDHELYLNPPPFIVPTSLKTSDTLQFSISKSMTFSDESTITSEKVPWSMYSPHKTLAAGTWYWRYRSVGVNNTGVWSNRISFQIKESTPKFATPPFEKLLSGIPASYPRLYCFLQTDLLANRSKVLTTSSDYKDMVSRAAGGLTWDYISDTDLSSKIGKMSTYIDFMYTAFHCTGDTKYSTKIADMIKNLLMQTIPDNIVSSDFDLGGKYLVLLIQSYDICYNEFTPTERMQIETRVVNLSTKFYRQHRNYDEQHVYNNHFWQIPMNYMFQIGLMFYDKYPIAKEMLKYYYELWSTRGPVGGFNRDGQHFYSIGYFNMDMVGLYYMSGMLSYLTGQSFFDHPWYQNCGKALLYSWPPLSQSGGFGDGSGGSLPPRTRIAFANYIARETNSSYAQWYVDQANSLQSNVMYSDYQFRIYRFAKVGAFSNPTLPNNRPKLFWFKDSGEAMIHSDISNTQNDLFLSMRSSPYGSGSHTHSDQNGFNLQYKGVDVYRSSGKYLNFSDLHNLLSYRHTQAHNSILVDGIGQAFTTRAYGNIPRALDGKNISYCLGDASSAYKCISEYSMWQKSFTAAGITQTPEFGFGETSLSRFRRHVLLLHPDKVLIYDDLEAGTPVRWDWLLHSANEFTIEEPNKRIVLEKNTNPLSSVESGSIINGCGVLSFDYIQSEADNVNLEVYVNDKLVSTQVTTNEKGVLKNSGSIAVNVPGSVKLKFKQKNTVSGQVGINNIKWTSFSTGINDLADQSNLFVIGKEGSMNVTTSRDGLLIINTLLGQQVISQKLTEGKHTISLPRGIYMTSFVSDRKIKTQKVVVK